MKKFTKKKDKSKKSLRVIGHLPKRGLVKILLYVVHLIPNPLRKIIINAFQRKASNYYIKVHKWILFTKAHNLPQNSYLHLSNKIQGKG